MYYRVFKSERDAKQLIAWWEWLDDNRGERAQLRRAVHPDDILLTPAFFSFLQQMNAGSEGENWLQKNKISLSDAAMLVAVLARVKCHLEDSGKPISFATALATPKEKNGKAVMSQLRFQQLQKSRTREDFFRRLCRAVALLKGTVNIISLSDDMLHWLKEYEYGPARKPADRLAVRWAQDYYTKFSD